MVIYQTGIPTGHIFNSLNKDPSQDDRFHEFKSRYNLRWSRALLYTNLGGVFSFLALKETVPGLNPGRLVVWLYSSLQNIT